MARDGTIKLYTEIDQKGANKGIKSLESSIKKLGAVIATVFAVGKIIEFGKVSLQAVSDLEAANTGLLSILNGQRKSFKEANQFINEYISDGLVPATNAINAYKNLSLRGYDTSQIESVMVALKDSSAFARQSQLSMGDAIQSASEGLKNENSMLVDNAGVTKNVAKMWKDYATSIGTTANNLTQQQKIQAEVNGILEETKFQIGDAARITQTYQGQVLALSFSMNNMKIAFGNFLKPIVQAVIPVVATLINWLTRLFNILAQVTSLLFGSAKSFGGQAAQQQAVADSGYSAADSQNALAEGTKKAAKEARGALAAFDDLDVLQKDTGSDSAGSGAGGVPAGGGGGGVGEFTPETLPQMEFDPKIVEAVERLKQALEPTIEALKRLGLALEPLKQFAAQALTDFYEHFLKPVGSWVLGEGLPRFIDAISNGLQQINWGKINASLVDLWKALAPFSVKIGKGLLWLWEKVLVPLAAWTISNVLPVFLDLLASGINILNGVIDALAPLAEWLWDGFLQPLAEWTGDLVLAALGFLNEKLSTFSRWVADNKGIIQGAAIVVAGFFAAWKAVELFSFVAISGGVVGAIKAMVTALAGATLAKLADKAETIALTLMYAKDFVVSLVQGTAALINQAAQWVINTALKIADTVAQVAMTAATVAWNIAATVAATVTAAFGAAVAFLTSPIGIVVVAVGALIGIIALLIKNWDKVKEVASKVWDKIKEVWNGVANWFNTTVIAPLSNFFTNLSQSIQDIFNGIITFFTVTFVNKWNEIWTGVKDTFKGVWDSFTDIVKTPINAIIGFINGMVSAVTSGINFIIRAMNNLSFDIPDWVPGIGGETFGFSVSEVSPPQIPYLASGAVLPPNKPFMAMVGDQKSGTNIEAPLSTIEQAVANVLAPLLERLIEATENNNTTITLDGEVLYNSGQKIGRNKGTNMVTGGARV